MSYYDRLMPWCIVRCLPAARTLIVQRFRRRGEAEEHLKIMRRLTPHAVYELLFDLPEQVTPDIGQIAQTAPHP